MWDLIVSVPDHCLSFYFEAVVKSTKVRFQTTKPCSNHGIHVLFEQGFYLIHICLVDWSISNFRGVWCTFSLLSYFR